MKTIATTTYVLYGLPRMSLSMRDDGKAGIVIEDTADRCGDAIYLSINARHAELLAKVVDDWNACTAVMEMINEKS